MPKSFEVISQTVADLADRHAIGEEHVALHPKLLRGTKIKAAEITEEVINHAHTLNRHAFAKLCARYGANKPAVVVEEEETVLESKSKRPKIMGLSVTSVVRWMGVDDWSIDEVVTALSEYGIKLTRGTISIQLKKGQRKEGTIPDLSDHQIDELYKFAKIS